MNKYADLQAQIAKLQREAEAMRQSEIDAAKDEIRKIMATHHLTLADLDGQNKKPRAKPPATVAPKYRDPESGATWTGRGRAPLWLNGRNKEDFKIE